MLYFNNKIINFFNEIQKISELFDKKDLPIEFTFKDEINQSIEILVNPIIDNTKNIENEEKIAFYLNFIKKKDLVDISELNQPSLDMFLEQYERFVNNYNTIDNNKQPKISLKKNLLKFMKLNVKLFRNKFILKFFVNPGYVFDVYTINGYDNKHISRTVIHSTDRLNIINLEFIDNFYLLDFHNKNMLLINHVIQNNISLVSKLISFSFRIIINFIRFWILLGGLIFNIYVNFTHINIIHYIINNCNYSMIFTNILISTIPVLLWFAAPKIIRYLIFKKKI
jgi:hypothetical protein